LNREQQSVLKWYAFLVVLMCLLIPWRQYKAHGDFTKNHALGYAFIFAPPSAADRGVDIARWAVGMIGITLATGALVLARATPRR